MAVDPNPSPEAEPAQDVSLDVILGIVSGAHGVSGRVRIKPFTQAPEGVGEYGPVMINGRTHKIRVTGVSKGHALAELEGVNDRNAAEALKGMDVIVSREALQGDEIEDGDWFHADLVDLDVLTQSGELLGKVEAVHNFGAGDLLDIRPISGGPTVLMAFTADNVPEVDVAGGRLVVDPPIGTFDEHGDEEKPAPKKRRRSPKARARQASKEGSGQGDD